MTVLLVEDNHVVAWAAQSALEQAGFTVAAAVTGQGALDLLEQHVIELLVVDIVLPGGLSGLDVAKAARRRHPGIGIVFTTGSVLPEDRHAAQALGPVLLKPYTIAALMQVLGTGRPSSDDPVAGREAPAAETPS